MKSEADGMGGETNLRALLRAMKPELLPREFVFATRAADEPAPRNLHPILQFEEAEGTTLIVPRDEAEQAAIAHCFPCRMITLDVQSSLDAIGFLAAVTAALAAAGIAVNPVSAFNHDHLFVPVDRAEEALRVLQRLADG